MVRLFIKAGKTSIDSPCPSHLHNSQAKGSMQSPTRVWSLYAPTTFPQASQRTHGSRFALVMPHTYLAASAASTPSKTAYWLHRSGVASIVLLLIAARRSHCNDIVQTSVLVRDDIAAAPFRWWQRNDSFTMDDGLLLGGISGIVLVRRSRNLQHLSRGMRFFARFEAVCAGSIATGANHVLGQHADSSMPWDS